jgi:outer membrane receptor for ferrienterochelin and colicins
VALSVRFVRRAAASVRLVVLLAPAAAHAQDSTGTVRVVVQHESAPVQGAVVRSRTVAAHTDRRGEAALRLPAGLRQLVVSRLGFKPESLSVDVRAGVDTLVFVALEEQAATVDEVVVSATRSERRIDDVPLRVEVLGREEVEEKMLMTPGDISMLLNETGGLRVQTTSPSLGGANVRVQGLRGRYTLMLSDGLPLFGGQTGTLGLLQIPPMDLGQVEVIKGVASALYGASALGGVVNLVTRRPREAPERELLANQTTRNGTDLVLWSSQWFAEHWGYTLLGGAHRQERVDVNRDGWTDIPGYRRAVVRPRFFWTGEHGRNALLTVGTTLEDRRGGTLDRRVAPDGAPYAEALDTRRFDAGGVGRFPFRSSVFTIRGSATAQLHRHRFGDVRERDRHDTYFAEATLTTARGNHTTVLGVALQRERYRSTDVPRFNYRYTIPAALAQYDVEPMRWLALSASGRVDVHSEYGTFFNPRLSALLRAPGGWTARLSGGTGAFAPTPFIEEIEVTGLTPLATLGGLRAERARSVSLDVGGTLGPLELNATVFGSRIVNALIVRDAAGVPDGLEIANATTPTRTRGADVLVRYRLADVTTTLTYTQVHSTEQIPDGSARREVPLTPRHSAGLVSVWEQEETGRLGLEVYYTGRQPLDENPYRTESRPYVIVGAIAERRVGSARLFINLENLSDVRMTKHQPLVRPTRGAGGRWTTDAWGPLDGRVVNAGLRVELDVKALAGPATVTEKVRASPGSILGSARRATPAAAGR